MTRNVAILGTLCTYIHIRHKILKLYEPWEGAYLLRSKSHFPTHFTQFQVMRLASACARVLFPRYLVSCERLGLITPPLLEYANHKKIGTSARCQRRPGTHRVARAAREARLVWELSAHHYRRRHYRETQFAVMPFSVSRTPERGYDREILQRILKARR